MTPTDKRIIADMATNSALGAPIDFRAELGKLTDEGVAYLRRAGGADAALGQMAELETARRAGRLVDWSAEQDGAFVKLKQVHLDGSEPIALRK